MSRWNEDENMEFDTVKIDDEQQLYYQKEEQKRISIYRKLYTEIVTEMKQKKEIVVLDIGGGGGFFARWLRDEILGGGTTDISLKIVVIDSVRYETWKEKDECIEYVLCDAIRLEGIFTEAVFDYIFCNMFVHHLLGKNFRESDEIRKRVFVNFNKLLKAGGEVLITDNINNGFLFDEASSRILFALTTCQKPLIIKVASHFGSHSAGSGVCMMSQKMWEKLLAETGFKIDELKLTKPDKWRPLRKIILMNREYRQKVLIVAKK